MSTIQKSALDFEDSMKINIENSSEILEQYKYLIIKTVNTFSIFEKEEAIDEAKEVVIDAIKNYDPKKASFSGYLKYRLYYHFLDKSKKQFPLSLNSLDRKGEELENMIKSPLDLEKDLLDKEKYQYLYSCIEKLKKDEKKLIYLKYFSNKSHKEIGEILGLASKTISNKHYLIIKKLRKEFKNF